MGRHFPKFWHNGGVGLAEQMEESERGLCIWILLYNMWQDGGKEKFLGQSVRVGCSEWIKWNGDANFTSWPEMKSSQIGVEVGMSEWLCFIW